MDSKQLFKTYHSRLKREGLLKSLVCGLIVCFAAIFAVAMVLWFKTEIKDLSSILLILVGVGAGALVLSMPIFYFTLFKPTTKSIARRVDRLGLEERIVTMLELENDDSYIAMRQREDAKEQLQKANSKQIKFVIARGTVIAAAIVAFIGVAMSTVTALSAMGILKNGKDFVKGDIFQEEEYDHFQVSYIAEEGGVIEGEAEQIVLYGESTATVVAVALDGWEFSHWEEDGDEIGADPSRWDEEITENREIFAVFVMLQEGGDGAAGEGEGPPGDEAGDMPGEGEGQPSDKPGNGNGEGAGGKHSNSDVVVNGATDYGDVFDDYFEEAMESLANGDSAGTDLGDIISAYYAALDNN